MRCAVCGGHTNIPIRKLLLTISRHPQRHALLEPAELTTVPVDSVHYTVLLSRTLVVGHTGLRPSEETLQQLHQHFRPLVDGKNVIVLYLAALARDHTIVNSAGFISTDFTRDYLDLC